jgi:hypothetical protein
VAKFFHSNEQYRSETDMKKLSNAAHFGVNQDEKENGTGVCSSQMRISVPFSTLMQPKKGKVGSFFEQAS